MSLVEFVSEPYTFTEAGGVAKGLLVRVLRRNTLVMARLPGGNPVRTGADGRLRFWAEAGEYDLLANGVRTSITLIDSSPDPEPTPAPPTGGAVEFVQSTPNTVWTIPHQLGTRPSVTLIMADGRQAFCGVEHAPTNNLVQLTFGSPRAGTAYLRT